MRITYRQTPPATVLYVRACGPYATSSREAWRQLEGWLDRHHARKSLRFGFGILHDNPKTTAQVLIRYDACILHAPYADLPPGEGIGRRTLPAGTWAVHIHVGPYGEAGDRISTLHRDLVPKRGLTVDSDRPFMAVYLNDPRVTREVHRRTELCIPVVPIPMTLAGNTESHVYAAAAVARRLAG
jgi:AraC family transcriptional regulator